MEIGVAISFIWMVVCIALFSMSRKIGKGKARTYVKGIGNTVSGRSGAEFLQRLFILGFTVRLLIVGVLIFTNAIEVLHLSPDSLRYHREGVMIARQMEGGFFNWPNWIDNGWFQFTGFVYYLFGPHPILIQLFNITIGSVTPVVVYHLLKKAYADEFVARWTAVFTAFFPSFVYWSCLMLKDPISIFAITTIVLCLLGIRQSFHVKWLLGLAGSLLIILGVREYLFFVAVFFVVASFIPVSGDKLSNTLIKMALLTVFTGALTYFMGFGVLGIDYMRSSHYFDMDYINSTRVAMGDHGSGAFFEDPGSVLWGGDIGSNVLAAATAIFYFFVSVDLTRLGSHRQLMALPEVLIFLSMLPLLFKGFWVSLKKYPQETLPLLVFTIGLMAVYGSATTNMGAMFRWRMQVLPFFLAFIVFGIVQKNKGFYFNTLRRFKI